MSDVTPHKYDPIVVSSESTVVAKYVPDAAGEGGYQSEADLERELIRLLKSQAYEYLPITSEADLIGNLRSQLEALNHVTFTDGEWKKFFDERIAGATEGIGEKTVRIQEDHVLLLGRDDGTFKNISIIDKKDVHNNRLQAVSYTHL
ncbi:MAG TPA: DEAD/DEAH box helicase, partial [Nitrospira sp.]|nr:DEAD/DEAH box helicase [Nitrospira sp.]